MLVKKLLTLKLIPMAEALTMNPAARKKLKEQYRVAKRVVTGSGVLELAKEIAINYGASFG